MTPLKNPPSGLIQANDNFFRRKQREIAFYLSTTFRLHLIHMSGCLVLIVLQLLIMNTSLMLRFENVFLDLFFRQRPRLEMSPAIVHIDMAEDSLQGFGRWPWPRHNHAALVHILHQWGARAIVFDVIFSDTSTSFDDESFAQAIKEAGNVYLSVMLEPVGGQKAWIHSLPELERDAKGIGHVNIYPDPDGAIRRVRPRIDYNGEAYIYLGAKVAFDYMGKDISNGDLGIPLDPTGSIFVNWPGRWVDSFQHYSFLDVIKSYGAIREGRSPVVSPEKIRGKICVIGLTALGLTDIKANPMEESYPGVGTQSSVMNGILTGQYLRPVDARWNRMALLILGLLVSIFFIFSRQALSFVFGLAIALLWILLAFWVFVNLGIWVYVMNPILLIFWLFVFSAIFSITVGKREQERLFSLATRDGLTGLYVIRHFRTLLNDAVVEACKKRQALSLILLDLDHFKNINDKYGHEAGDVALRYVADTLRTMTRVEGDSGEPNVPARYGGEEFIVLFKKCHLIDAAFNYGEKIRRQFEQNPFTYEGVKIPLTVSMGVSTLRPGETVPDLMVHRADEALYRAKSEGRNRACIEKEGGSGTEVLGKLD